jgi:aminopeptidase
MRDPRVTAFAELLVHHACDVQRGDNVLIEVIDAPVECTTALVHAVHAAGGQPLVELRSRAVERALHRNSTREQWEVTADVEAFQTSRVQCYIVIRGSHNITELADVPEASHRNYHQTVWRRVHREHRLPNTRWVVARWPSSSMAQLAGMSTHAFEDYFFDVCTVDYARLERAMQPLQELVARTDRVRLQGPGETELAFSISGIPAVPFAGRKNIPDGELLTAPVVDSVEGTIEFNCPTIYQGSAHDRVRLVFREGRAVEATSSNPDALRDTLGTDEGARRVGEFAIGVNPLCTRPIRDVLFDEKMAGSVHLALGNSYAFAFNGNRSDIHWDLVLLQTSGYGGGEMWFDDRLVRKDGHFVAPELEGLNPDRLLLA